PDQAGAREIVQPCFCFYIDALHLATRSNRAMQQFGKDSDLKWLCDEIGRSFRNRLRSKFERALRSNQDDRNLRVIAAQFAHKAQTVSIGHKNVTDYGVKLLHARSRGGLTSAAGATHLETIQRQPCLQRQ